MDVPLQKPGVTIVLVGHGSSGKSTLLGRLLEDRGAFSRGDIAEAARAAGADGDKSDESYAGWLIDTSKIERVRKCTVDLRTIGIRAQQVGHKPSHENVSPDGGNDVGTSETTHSYFKKPSNSAHIESEVTNFIDIPGNRKKVKTAAVGIASADAGIIVVSALAQELATGCGAGGQTREHIEILHGMGIGRLIVAVTKMDEILHDEAESAFTAADMAVRQCMRECGYDADVVCAIPVIPVSGCSGRNLVDASARVFASDTFWDTQPLSLQGAIDRYLIPTNRTRDDRTPASPKRETTVHAADTPGAEHHVVVSQSRGVPADSDSMVNARASSPSDEAALRFTVQGVHKVSGCGTVVVGRVLSGQVTVGDEMVFAPGDMRATVASIEMTHCTVHVAGAGSNIGICLTNVPWNMLKRGMVGGSAKFPPRTVKRFTAEVRVLRTVGAKDNGVGVGYTPVINTHSAYVPCVVTDILWIRAIPEDGGDGTALANTIPSSDAYQYVYRKDETDSTSGADGTTDETDDVLVYQGDIALLQLTPTHPLCVEAAPTTSASSTHPETAVHPEARTGLRQRLSRLVVRDAHQTVGVGIVTAVQY